MGLIQRRLVKGPFLVVWGLWALDGPFTTEKPVFRAFVWILS